MKFKIFLHDKGNLSLSSNLSGTYSTTILAKNGIIEDKNVSL